MFSNSHVYICQMEMFDNSHSVKYNCPTFLNHCTILKFSIVSLFASTAGLSETDLLDTYFIIFELEA